MPHIHVVDGQAEGVFQGLCTLTHVMKQRSVHSVYCADLKYLIHKMEEPEHYEQ